MFKDQLINKVIRTRVEAARAKKVMLPKEVVRKRNLSFRVLFFDVYEYWQFAVFSIKNTKKGLIQRFLIAIKPMLSKW